MFQTKPNTLSCKMYDSLSVLVIKSLVSHLLGAEQTAAALAAGLVATTDVTRVPEVNSGASPIFTPGQ